MKISGRVTHSLYCFLNQHNFDTTRLYELTPLETSFIKDPSVWMDIDLVEHFLQKLTEEYGRHFVDKDFVTSVGHSSVDLKAWGDLDRILKFVQLSSYYLKIDEILKWFVTPLEIFAFKQEKNKFSFQCDLSSIEYPHVVEYLRSMLEALPTFKSEPMMEVTWEGTIVSIGQTETPVDKQLSFSIEDFEPSESEYEFLLPQTPVKIHKIIGRELLDSRGQPALEVEVISENGLYSSALVPSGASTGKFEAHELRDEDPLRFYKKGLLRACQNIQKVSDQFKGFELSSIEGLDQKLIELDGTSQKTNLGANVILGISLAGLKMLSYIQNKELFSFFNPKQKMFHFPVPLINVLNGGAHAHNNLDVQEFMIVPHGFLTFREAIRSSSEIFHSLKEILKNRNLSTSVGDEGGVAPSLSSNEEALDLLLLAIEKAGYQPGNQVSLALDVAASSLFKEGTYLWEGKLISSHDLIGIYDKWIRKYPLVSIEDGLDEESWEDWKIWTKKQGSKVQIVGDDLFVTNCGRLKKGIHQNVANALLVKVNQIGTITEAYQAVKMSHQAKYKCILSHRSGETEDTTIADLSLAFGCEQIKMGGVTRGERTAKYNQLLRIEEQLGSFASYSHKL